MRVENNNRDERNSNEQISKQIFKELANVSQKKKRERKHFLKVFQKDKYKIDHDYPDLPNKKYQNCRMECKGIQVLFLIAFSDVDTF